MKATKAFLYRVKKLDQMIENKKEERERWYLLATNITAGSAPETGVRVQSSSSQQRMADAIDRSIDISAEIDEAIRQLYNERKEIIAMIEQLSFDEYDILYKVYIQYHTLTEVAEMKNRSYSWVTSVHGIALKNMQKIIDSKTGE